MKKATKHILLKGEGANQHVLHGDFLIEDKVKDFSKLVINRNGLLKHEKPDGSFSNEHKTLSLENGNWVTGKQVEYNPFRMEITQIWD
jgi:hypothetical protein